MHIALDLCSIFAAAQLAAAAPAPAEPPQPVWAVALKHVAEMLNQGKKSGGVGPGFARDRRRSVFGVEWMAARLKRVADIDPLTIDQTTLSPRAESPDGRALYQLLKPRLRGTRNFHARASKDFRKRLQYPKMGVTRPV